MNRFGQHLRLSGTPPRLFISAVALGVAFVSQGGFIPSSHAAEPAAAVDGARISAADQEPGNWMSHGRTYDEQRFSPLKKSTTTT